MIDRIRSWLNRRERPERDPAALRKTFQQHYSCFRSLLTANNNALEIMAEMEQTLKGSRPFGMAFVRSRSSALGFQVYKMIQRLQDLSSGRYGGLAAAYGEISSRIEGMLSRPPQVDTGPFVLDLSEIDRFSVDQVGEKMANLGEIANRVGLDVPDGFVITAAAANHFFKENDLLDEINRRLTIFNPDNLEELYTTSAGLNRLISTANLPADLAAQIAEAYGRLARRCGTRPVLAMRSSALGEDGKAASFAGQYRTQLQVGEDVIGDTYKDILGGKYKSQAIVYRLQRGFRHEDVTMCVGCLAMVDAVWGGVVYSRSPRDLRSPYILISAAGGHAGQVVEGTADPVIVTVERFEPHAVVSGSHDRGRLPDRPPEEVIRELARLAVRLEDYFGAPQDIEWAVDRTGAVVVLQSRTLGIGAVAPEADLPAHPETEIHTDLLLHGGVCASAGVGCGQAVIVRSNLDLLSFPRGAVLLVEHPLPEWTTLLPRAAAVISETGEIAAHLATVAREFGIPAIFGLKGALESIGSGSEITVDAGGCRVYAGSQGALLEENRPPANLMRGSPVYETLEQILACVTPLNLVDPASPYFRPSSCRTFHDITRFCHEKAVTEMFSFGARHHYDEKAARRLVGETPYQWWVIDLDDGFSPDVARDERFIAITQIVSAPMLAIWEGMTAIPWQGPPPVDLRGFGSILLQSTMNRDLDPAVRSSMPDRNYFMISKKFCNLSVRLGYHFSLVEAHVSDMLTENYVSFQFKGGAADRERRSMRVSLLADVLQHYEFRVTRNEDVLGARIEKRDAPFLLGRLKVLGYLLMHTRQIDMVMGEREKADKYRRKMHADIESILADDAGDSR